MGLLHMHVCVCNTYNSVVPCGLPIWSAFRWLRFPPVAGLGSFPRILARWFPGHLYIKDCVCLPLCCCIYVQTGVILITVGSVNSCHGYLSDSSLITQPSVCRCLADRDIYRLPSLLPQGLPFADAYTGKTGTSCLPSKGDQTLFRVSQGSPWNTDCLYV